jgi:hypothetical protein
MSDLAQSVVAASPKWTHLIGHSPFWRKSRAAKTLYWTIRSRQPLRHWPRPGYCACCNAWAWLTNEIPAYSAYDGAYLCEDCADENDHETHLAWRDYYEGRL